MTADPKMIEAIARAISQPEVQPGSVVSYLLAAGYEIVPKREPYIPPNGNEPFLTWWNGAWHIVRWADGLPGQVKEHAGYKDGIHRWGVFAATDFAPLPPALEGEKS